MKLQRMTLHVDRVRRNRYHAWTIVINGTVEHKRNTAS